MKSVYILFIDLDLRRLMRLCCISNREVIFLFVDTQIIDSLFLEDINALLHTGEVPNLFRDEDINEVRLLSMHMWTECFISLEA